MYVLYEVFRNTHYITLLNCCGICLETGGSHDSLICCHLLLFQLLIVEIFVKCVALLVVLSTESREL